MARWAELTGRAADDLHWFLIFAGLRFTVVMLRLGTLLPAMGFAPSRSATTTRSATPSIGSSRSDQGVMPMRATGSAAT